VPQHFIPKAGQFPFDRLLNFHDFSEINRAIDDARSGETIEPLLSISRE
jgi:aryl-alcohol dehydrogenase